MLIHVDKEGIEKEKESIKLASSHLNTLFSLLPENDIKLTQADIKKLPDYPEKTIKDNLKKRYQFKKANDAFNLEALGIDLTEILEYIKENQNHWLRYDFNYSDGAYTIDDENKYLEKYYHYAKSERDKKIVLAYDQLARTVNELKGIGVMIHIPTLMESMPRNFYGIRLTDFTIDYIVVDGKRMSSYLSAVNFSETSTLNTQIFLLKNRILPAEILESRSLKHITDRYKK